MSILNIFKEKTKWDKYYTKGEKENFELFKGTIYEMLLNTALRTPLNRALSYYDSVYSYSEFLDKIDEVAASLKDLGLKKGDVISIIMPNTPEALATIYASSKLGIIVSLMHPLSGEEEFKDSLINTGSKFLLAIDLIYNKLLNIINETSVEKVVLVSASKSMKWYYKAGYFVTKGYKVSKPKYNDLYISFDTFLKQGEGILDIEKVESKSEDPAIILHSGGTTGKPKGIVLSNSNLSGMTNQFAYIFKYTPFEDANVVGKCLAILPIFHGFGLMASIHAPLTLGFEIMLMPQFDPKKFAKTFYKAKPSLLLGVPSLFDFITKSRYLKNKDLSFLKLSIAGGDTLSPEMETTLNEFFIGHGSRPICAGYGLTEATAATITNISVPHKLGTLGIPLYGNDFKICVPGTLEEVAPHETGEICISGPTVMMGYLNNPKETNDTLQRHDNGRIYLHTGDLAYFDSDNYLVYVQRLKRMIITSGYNVYPSYIESILSKHEAVSSVVVVGKKHKYKGEVVHAYIVLKEGYKETSRIKKELRALAEKNLAKYALPKDYHFRRSLPQTHMGKINYRELEEEE